MPDFAALKEAGAAPQGVNFAGSDDPYNLPEYMARDYGLTPEQCAAPPAPTEDTLRNQGFTMRQYGDGPQEWTSPAKAGTTPLTFSMADPAAMAQRPPGLPEPRIESGPNGEARAVGQPSPEAQMNEVIKDTASVVTAGINAAVRGDFGSAAGLGGAIGDALGIPHAGEAAALASQVRDLLKPGEMGAMLSDPLAMANGLTGVLDALGIPVPPALKVAIQQAKQIADALKTAAPPGGGIPGVYAVGQFVARMGTSMTSHGTPLLPGPGAVNVLCLGTPVWRAGLDLHVCPLAPPPHVGGLVPPTQLSVLALGGPIARHAADKVMEGGGGPNPIIPMTQAVRDAERKRQKEEEEKKKREEAERKKREQEAKAKREASSNSKVVRGEMTIHSLKSGDKYEGDGGYYTGEESKVGHTWIEVVGYDKDGNVITREVVGRMPTEGNHFGWMSGEDGYLADHSGLKSTSDSPVMNLSKDEYDRAMAQISLERQDPDYTVLGNDCMDTVRRIGEAGGANIPTSVFPSDMTGATKQAQVEPYVSPTTPVGRSGNPLRIPGNPPQNRPGTVYGRDYRGHAFDEMQSDGIYPSVVENTVVHGKTSPGNTPETVRHYDPDNNVTVITTDKGDVITAYRGGH